MQPGYMPNGDGLPYIPLVSATNITSTSYLFSDAYVVGACVQVAIFVAATLGGGVTSVELKLQQSLTDAAGGTWFDYALVDVANKATVSNEYVSIVKSYVLRIDASTGSDPLGPIPFPLMYPFFRLAYKISGAGTANLDVAMARVQL